MSGAMTSATNGNSVETATDEPPIRVMALHALLYCERLFYLEEVEELRVADASVYAGRRLHDDIVPLDDESPEHRSLEVASERWGIIGKVDAVRRRDGLWVVYEHKRGRCRRDDDNRPTAWPSDRIQAVAYAVLLEEEFGEPVPQARIRYHADNVTAFVEVDEQAHLDLQSAIDRARVLRRSLERPPIHENEHFCRSCSLAPVCLPEEERLTVAGKESDESADDANVETRIARSNPKLFPSDRQRQTLHVTSHKAYVSRSGESLVVSAENAEKQFVPIQSVDAVVVHGFGQVTTQAIQLCSYHDVAVLWLSAAGQFVAGTANSPGRVQQRIRQYRALADEPTRLRLTRQLVHAKVETQLRYLLRSTRGDSQTRLRSMPHIERIRESLRKIPLADSADSLRGLEGMAAKSYFAAFPQMLANSVPSELRPDGRSRRPPRDRFNALLSFGYALIQTLVHRSVIAVGLEPAFGFFHRPRSAAPPLMLDVMELFRTPLWEIPLIGSINRGQWNISEDFEIRKEHVWLSTAGRKKAIQLFEQRLQESYKHPYTGQSLTYARIVELELRLLEKEWTGCPGLFAQLRIR